MSVFQVFDGMSTYVLAAIGCAALTVTAMLVFVCWWCKHRKGKGAGPSDQRKGAQPRPDDIELAEQGQASPTDPPTISLSEAQARAQGTPTARACNPQDKAPQQWRRPTMTPTEATKELEHQLPMSFLVIGEHPAAMHLMYKDKADGKIKTLPIVCRDNQYFLSLREKQPEPRFPSVRLLLEYYSTDSQTLLDPPKAIQLRPLSEIRAPPGPPKQGLTLMVTAVHDFDAATEGRAGDLSFKQGDVVWVSPDASRGAHWIDGRLHDGQRGKVPPSRLW
eukprot:m.120988 g.120988  ORF g.120988 m.120988 type:complete len:277 (-) comp16521_c0_seq2:114-944(-)